MKVAQCSCHAGAQWQQWLSSGNEQTRGAMNKQSNCEVEHHLGRTAPSSTAVVALHLCRQKQHCGASGALLVSARVSFGLHGLLGAAPCLPLNKRCWCLLACPAVVRGVHEECLQARVVTPLAARTPLTTAAAAACTVPQTELSTLHHCLHCRQVYHRSPVPATGLGSGVSGRPG